MQISDVEEVDLYIGKDFSGDFMSIAPMGPDKPVMSCEIAVKNAAIALSRYFEELDITAELWNKVNVTFQGVAIEISLASDANGSQACLVKIHDLANKPIHVIAVPCEESGA